MNNARRIVLATLGALLAPAARADLPARNVYTVRTQDVIAAARGFAPEALAAFRKAVENSVIAASGPPKGGDPATLNVREDAFFNAVATLVISGQLGAAQSFLAAVSQGRFIRGRLIARTGGEFVTVLSLDIDPAGNLVLRQRNDAVTPGSWKGTTIDRALVTRRDPAITTRP